MLTKERASTVAGLAEEKYIHDPWTEPSCEQTKAGRKPFPRVIPSPPRLRERDLNCQLSISPPCLVPIDRTARNVNVRRFIQFTAWHSMPAELGRHWSDLMFCSVCRIVERAIGQALLARFVGMRSGCTMASSLPNGGTFHCRARDTDALNRNTISEDIDRQRTRQEQVTGAGEAIWQTREARCRSTCLICLAHGQ